MGEEKAVPCIQSFDLFHFIICQREIKDIKVLFHAVFMRGLWDQDHIALKEKTQRGLRDGLSVSLTDLFEYRVVEIVIFTFCEWSPGHDLGSVLFHIFFCGLLLLEHMCLNLVHCRFDPGEVTDVQKTARIEIGYADSADFAFIVSLLHGAVGTIVIAEGLMDQEKIDIICLKLS